jgi:hypothetical protein
MSVNFTSVARMLVLPGLWAAKYEFLNCQSEFLYLSISFSFMISRTKIENVTSLTFNFINITLYVLITTAAITKSIAGDFVDIVVCIYTA